MDQQNDLFSNIEKHTNVKKEDIFQLADAVQHANFEDEETVRGIIQQVSNMAGVSVSKEKEEQIVSAIVNKQMPLDLGTITQMFNQK